MHISPWFIPGRDPSLNSYLHPSSLWHQSFVSTLCVIALLWASFHDSCYGSVSPLKDIFTNLHDVCLPLSLHHSPIIRWHIIHHKTIPTHLSVHMGWDRNVWNAWSGLLSTWSYSIQLQEYHFTPLHSTLFDSTPFNSNMPIWQIVACLHVNCMVKWPMWWEWLSLSAENLQKISIDRWINTPLSGCTIFVVGLASSANVSSQLLVDMEW